MSIEVIGQFIPVNNKTFPVVDVDFVKGGNQVVASTGDLSSIPLKLRSEDTLVYVTGSNVFYYLNGGILNQHWTEIDFLEENDFAHTQSLPSTEWTINHNLDFYPNVTTINSTGKNIIGSVIYDTPNTLRVLFNKAYSGSGYLS